MWLCRGPRIKYLLRYLSIICEMKWLTSNMNVSTSSRISESFNGLPWMFEFKRTSSRAYFFRMPISTLSSLNWASSLFVISSWRLFWITRSVNPCKILRTSSWRLRNLEYLKKIGTRYRKWDDRNAASSDILSKEENRWIKNSWKHDN